MICFVKKRQQYDSFRAAHQFFLQYNNDSYLGWENWWRSAPLLPRFFFPGGERGMGFNNG